MITGECDDAARKSKVAVILHVEKHCTRSNVQL